MKTNRIIFHNPNHANHKGWIDENGKRWDVASRVDRLVEALKSDATTETEWVYVSEARPSTVELVHMVHTPGLIQAIDEAGRTATEDRPIKSTHDRDEETDASAIYPGTFEQAMVSIECSVMAAEQLAKGDQRTIISLSRPGGHHAGRDFHHGFSYFNTIGLAAYWLKLSGRVATLDFDAHHGNGTQDIFHDDSQVLCVSLHADPDQVFPHSGREDEIGVGAGIDTTMNLPFAIGISADSYLGLLRRATQRIKMFGPAYLVIAAGFDAHMYDHVGLPPLTYLGDDEYRNIGEIIGSIGIPTMHILSGGYNQEVTSEALLAYLRGVESARDK